MSTLALISEAHHRTIISPQIPHRDYMQHALLGCDDCGHHVGMFGLRTLHTPTNVWCGPLQAQVMLHDRTSTLTPTEVSALIPTETYLVDWQLDWAQVGCPANSGIECQRYTHKINSFMYAPNEMLMQCCLSDCLDMKAQHAAKLLTSKREPLFLQILAVLHCY